MANQTYYEYPSMRYHKTLAPEGREIPNAAKDAELGEGWVDTPAAFEPGYVAPEKRFKDGDPLPVARQPGQEYVPYPAMRHARDGQTREVKSAAEDAALDQAVWKDTPDPKAWGSAPVTVAAPAPPKPSVGSPAVEDQASNTGLAAPPEASAAPAATASPIAASLYLLNAAESTLLVNGQDTAEKLDEVEAAERAHPRHDGGRVSVLRAIEERREALAAQQA